MTVARLLPLLALAAVAAACGGDRDAEPPRTTAAPRPTTNAAPPARGERARRGRQLVAQAGCLACHQIGRAGNDGPGPELSSIGYRLPASAIARTLVAPTAPMPSFADLPRADRAAIVAYLVTLRGPDRGERSKRIRGSNERR